MEHILIGGAQVGGGRYRIQHTIAADRYGVWYAGEDVRHARSVRLWEYFPRDYVERDGSGTMRVCRDTDQGIVGTYRNAFGEYLGTLAQLQHAVVDRPIELVEDNATTYAVFEELEGPDLASWAADLTGPPSQAEIDRIAGALLSALGAIHDAGLWHLAIRTEAIVLCNGHAPRLTAFGGSRCSFLRATGAMEEAVYPGFSAPELYGTDANAIGPRTDLYGCAATLQAVLTGRPPPAATIRARESWLPVPIPSPGPDFRPDFLQAVATTLAPDPAQRPPSAHALSTLLLDTPLPMKQRENLEQRVTPGGRFSRSPQPDATRTSPVPPSAEAPSAQPAEAPVAYARVMVPWIWLAALAAFILSGLYFLDIPLVPRSGSPSAPEIAQPQPDPVLTEIASTTNRETLLRIAARLPVHTAAVEQRLGALGFIKVPQQSAALWLKPGAGEVFRDCPDCPELVLLPAGRFRMGSPAGEDGRTDDEDDTPGPGGTPIAAVISQPIAVGRFEVTRSEFAAFAHATGHRPDGGCYERRGVRTLNSALSWQSPGFEQDDRHPVTCVSHEDARAFLTWLSERTGQAYRLPSEAEWEYAARADESDAPFSFGQARSEICRHGNGADGTAREANPGWEAAECRDGFVHTAPVGTFLPNGAGLYDVHGNVWEWVTGCGGGAINAAAPGSDCSGNGPRVLRGGSWSDPPHRLRSAARIAGPPETRDQIAGFRVARSIAP